ncbi:carbon monoxide dehydrogenase [Siccirubricoccus deserti]|uniref:Xanthine dehydrogenase family protein molybdopterin-binding subunit n=1 Tax=Siccirubricoccus deserti TaxID=2013562 RepID=A0A9X0QWN4_9PROT|nr:xanthine dehydrogenase family protein molybdopterin-binding subunit [Siccirubricoccus deserti]MBC4014603.1 xanthine dehydrogenase family protein molybdopterin-binding subunit [Siccirubricoccus deserti]GGC31553.1 carbon monoxide dehydrogenase [Siccirubricoccus deserti]
MSGESLRRREDARFLTGQGRYTGDLIPAGALHGMALRSPHAHARILSIDAAVARGMPGVHLVLTGADLAAEGLGPLPCPAQVATLAPIIIPARHALARDAVKHVGEPVAFVVADTPALARDAAEAIAVEYEALPAVVESRAALAPGAPQLWPEAPGNCAFRFERGDRAATEAGIAAAAHVIVLELINNRVHAIPMEPRTAVAQYADGRFDLLLSGQGVHGIRRQLAKDVFHLPEADFRLHCPDVGGGFGAKNFLFPEYVALLSAARRLGRAIAWTGEATEEFQGSVHARDYRGTARLALDAEGRFLALHAQMVGDLGAYCSANGPACPTNSVSTAIGGVYAIPAIFLEVTGAFTNTLPVDAYRGAGKPEANYLTERLVEAAARHLGLDPIEIRRRNAIASFPYRSATGMLMDTGRFGGNLADLEVLADRAGFAARRAASEARGRLRGLGIACFLETSRGAPHEWAAVRFAADGMVDLAIGTQSNGQGHETSFPQIAAAQLGLPAERFRLVQADTDAVAFGNGHGGARSLHVGGTALVMAMDTVLAKARLLAAHLLQAAPEEVAFAAGRFTVVGTERGMALEAVAEAARDPAMLPEGMTPGLDAEAKNLSELVTFPSGAHVAEVEIDPETGAVALLRYQAVDDYGRLINPLLTTGQVQGGLAQGIGQALLEEVVYDPESGQLLSASFMDYALPRAEDLPDLEVALRELPTLSNPLGVKGVGQAGAIAAPQTVMHAVLDALRPRGVSHIDMPATPEKIWRALRAAA